MDASDWIALAAVAFSLGASLITYGALRQKVTDLERRVGAVEGHDRAVIRLEVQVENLIELVKKLDAKISDSPPRAPRARAVK